MTGEVRIRPMRPDDLAEVMEIERAAYSTPWPESSFRGLLTRADADLLVAEVEGRVSGYAICWAVLDQGELGNIAVAPEWRRRGIARRLLDAVVDAMRERGVRELYLEVRVSNHAAQGLYRQFAFNEVSRRRHYYSNPVEDALVMRRTLDL